MTNVPRPPRGAKPRRARLPSILPPEHPPLGQVIPFPTREAALERGLEHLFRAHALSPAPAPLVRFSAASSADLALSAFEEALHPFGLRASRDAVDQAAIGAWFDAAILSAGLRSNPPCAPSSALMRALGLVLPSVSNDVGMEIMQALPLARRCGAERGMS
jgi:hypothetical protein